MNYFKITINYSSVDLIACPRYCPFRIVRPVTSGGLMKRAANFMPGDAVFFSKFLSILAAMKNDVIPADLYSTASSNFLYSCAAPIRNDEPSASTYAI